MPGTGFLGPVYYPASLEIWGNWLLEALPDEPEGFIAKEATLEEAGPLRWLRPLSRRDWACLVP